MESTPLPFERIERNTLSRALFMYAALEITDHDYDKALGIWRAAGGAHYYDIDPEAYLDPDDPIMDDTINMPHLYARMRKAEEGDRIERSKVMSSPARWNVYVKLINDYFAESDDTRFLPWNKEIHGKIRHKKNLEIIMGGVALLAEAYESIRTKSD